MVKTRFGMMMGEGSHRVQLDNGKWEGNEKDGSMDDQNHGAHQGNDQRISDADGLFMLTSVCVLHTAEIPTTTVGQSREGLAGGDGSSHDTAEEKRWVVVGFVAGERWVSMFDYREERRGGTDGGIKTRLVFQ